MEACTRPHRALCRCHDASTAHWSACCLLPETPPWHGFLIFAPSILCSWLSDAHPPCCAGRRRNNAQEDRPSKGGKAQGPSVPIRPRRIHGARQRRDPVQKVGALDGGGDDAAGGSGGSLLDLGSKNPL